MNLPVKSLSVAANGVVAAILEDGDVTWINVYNPTGEKAVGIKTTMQKSGYPVSVSLSDNGKLMMVAYLKAESGSMKSIVSFYNFDEVGQNYTDTMVSILISSTIPFFIPAYPRQRANKITQTSSTFIFSPVYFISIISMLFTVTARNRFPPSVFKSCVCSGIGPLYFSFPFRL